MTKTTTARTADIYISGWACAYRNNTDVVDAWRSDGGCEMEAEGTIEPILDGAETMVFVPTRMRIVSGAVDHNGAPLQCPRPWV